MMQLTFDATTHTYRAGNQLLPSVTQIIQAQRLGPDYSMVPPATLRRKAALGTAVHLACQEILLRGRPSFSFCSPRGKRTGPLGYVVDDRLRAFALGFEMFLADTGYQQLGGEKPLADLELGYAGTPDSYGNLNGGACIIDFKTATTLHRKAAAVQTHAYWRLLRATGGFRWPIEGYYALQLKPGAYRLVDVRMPGVEQVWLAAIEEHFERGTAATAAVLAEWRER